MSVFELLGVHAVLIELTEELLQGGHILGNGTGDPGVVHVVLEGDVLGNDVAAPGAAAHGGRRRHAVRGAARVALVVGLADHDTGDRRHHSKAMDVIVVEGVDAAGVALAADLVDCADHIERVLELAVILEQSHQGGQLLTGEQVLLADVLAAAAGNGDELAVSRNLKAGLLGELLRRDGDGVGQTVTGLIPHDELELFGLVDVGKIGALLDQSLDKIVIDGGVADDVAVTGAAGTEVGALGDAAVLGDFRDALGRVRSLVDNLGGVARTGAERGRTRRVGRLDHRTAAGGDDEVDALHQFLRHGNARVLDALNNVGGSTFLDEGLTDDVDALVGDILCARMGGADQHVARLNRVDDLTGGRQAGIGRGD